MDIGRSCTVAGLIGQDLRFGDVDSKTRRSTPPTTPGTRTSMMAIRTTTTRRPRAAPASSAASSGEAHAGFSLESLTQAYLDCRRTKRNSDSARRFEFNRERNLVALYDDLLAGTYRPGLSICFMVTRPKPREVWAAEFRDRIVHHLMYNHIGERFLRGFIADSCACIPGRGTLYAGQRLESKIRSATENWSKPVYYLKIDLANFFVAIDKHVLWQQLAAKIDEPFWRRLTWMILFHDPRRNFELRGNPDLMGLVPPHKRLGGQLAHLGLPIGNLSSQFFANVYLNVLDQFIKHQLRCRHYIRYVDDAVLLHEDPRQLSRWLWAIEDFLPAVLGAHLNPSKTIIQPVDRGVDFVGHVIKPWRRTTRRRVVQQGIRNILTVPDGEVFEKANSYFGLFRQASHSHADRAQLGRAVLARGYTIDGALTKSFRGTSS